MAPSFSTLLRDVRACTLCAAHLPLGPRPVVQLHPAARILIAGQAPGRKVHESGIPFADYTTNWLNFAGPYPGDAETKTITVTSTGSGPLVMSDIWIEDTEWTEHPAANPSTEYTVASETCTTAPVAPGRLVPLRCHW